MNDDTPKPEHRSEAPASETSGKKVRQKGKPERGNIEPMSQPKQFQAKGTEVRK